MVFHEIESITDVVSGHRVIIYYVEDDTESKWKLRKSVESVMETLGKKNDDLIMFKVSQNTHQFSQFKELYKPEISGPIALFVINTEGIPLICEQIYKEDNIYQAFDSVCTHCKLNSVSKSDITKAINCEPETIADKTNTDIPTNGLQQESVHQVSKITSLSESNFPTVDSGFDISKDSQEGIRSISTELQIRLPDGTKEKQKFDKHALLQEVFDFIRTKFNLNDFDLKTYNRNIFSAEDYEKTLQDLDLTPNGVITVVYKNVVPFSNNSIIPKRIQYGFWILFGKVTPIFLYVQGLLHAFWNSFFSSGNRSSGQIPNQAEKSHSSSKKGATNGVKKSSSRFGNIHTLRRNDDSDDENNRYNGNSTQQK